MLRISLEQNSKTMHGFNPLPVFESAKGWLPYSALGCNSMDEHWKQVLTPDGLMDIQGCNYYVFPAPLPGERHSAHFDPQTPFFQSFFGFYLAHPLPTGPVPLEVVPILGERDNTGWLRLMGEKEKVSKILSNSITCIEKRDGQCVKWKFLTRYSMPLDVGPCNPGREKDCPPPDSEIPDLWKAPGRIWEPFVNGYEDAIQSPVIQYVWYEDSYLIINFLIGNEYRDRFGNSISTWDKHPELHKGLESMAASARILRRKEDFRCSPGL